jgi:hypothetical protein
MADRKVSRHAFKRKEMVTRDDCAAVLGFVVWVGLVCKAMSTRDTSLVLALTRLVL